ncbi:hypothetical protein GCM10023178_42770 [Actinomadura luteofluorescens]
MAIADPPFSTLRNGLPDRYLTPEDIASLFSVPLETVYQWRIRYDPAAVRQWATERMAADTAA